MFTGSNFISSYKFTLIMLIYYFIHFVIKNAYFINAIFLHLTVMELGSWVLAPLDNVFHTFDPIFKNQGDAVTYYFCVPGLQDILLCST